MVVRVRMRALGFGCGCMHVAGAVDLVARPTDLFLTMTLLPTPQPYNRHHAAQLKRYTYGKHILVRLEKISGEKFV